MDGVEQLARHPYVIRVRQLDIPKIRLSFE